MKKDPFGKEFDDQFKDPFFTDTDNYIIKAYLKYLALILVIAVLLFISLSIATSKYNKKEDATKFFLGKKVVFDKDTITIINYSFLDKTYTLSDGNKYDMSLVETHTINNTKMK